MDDYTADELALAERRMELRQTLDSPYRTVRVRCDDGSLSYPLARSYLANPLSRAECVRIVAQAIRDGMARTRIPDCPPIPGRG